jgi:hypothetical protein
MSTIPSEAFYLAEHLDKSGSALFRAENGEKLDKILVRLNSIRSEGIEDEVIDQ